MSVYRTIKRSIKASKKSVFLRPDFERFGKRSIVNTALRQLTQEGLLLRAGYGVYVKTKKDETGVYPSENILTVAQNVLERMDILYGPSSALEDYNAGRSTQVPVNPALTLKGNRRFNRKIGFKKKVVWERE